MPGYPIFWDNRPGYARPSDHDRYQPRRPSSVCLVACGVGGEGRRAGEGVGADGGLSPPHTDQQVPARRLLASRDRHVRRTGMVQSESRVDSAALASRHPAWVAGRTL